MACEDASLESGFKLPSGTRQNIECRVAEAHHMRTSSLITGTWRGRYCYDPDEGAALEGVAFTMKLKGGWWPGRFTGICIDHDAALGNDPPRIVGRVRGFEISLAKRYREAWVATPDGTRTLRQWLSECDIVTNSYIPPQVVEYMGTLDASKQIARGTWRLHRPELTVRGHNQAYILPAGEGTGTWVMQRE